MLGSTAKVVVRRGRAADAKELANVFRESWLLAYRGIIPHLHLESMIRRRGPEWWVTAIRTGEGILVLELNRMLAGYASCGKARARSKYQGEIYELYLAPIYQGVGLGERLFEGCRHSLDMRGLNGLIVWSLADNTPAVDFYRRRGGRQIAQSTETIGGAKLDKIALAWT
jgi:ribosomal protein S18 acetylase RimI-like enzyme